MSRNFLPTSDAMCISCVNIRISQTALKKLAIFDHHGPLRLNEWTGGTTRREDSVLGVVQKLRNAKKRNSDPPTANVTPYVTVT